MLYAWQQRDQESCGAAALMVALAELGIGGRSALREAELWQAIRAQRGYPGSLPGLIAVRASQEGVVPTVWIDEGRLDLAEAQLGSLAGFDVPLLLQEHRRGLDQAEQAGLELRREPTNPDELLRPLRKNGRLMVAVAVQGHDRAIYLHWLLYRYEGGSLVGMDPASGANTATSAAAFAQLLTGIQYVGTAVSLLRPRG